jgi:hypothetical protein
MKTAWALWEPAMADIPFSGLQAITTEALQGFYLALRQFQPRSHVCFSTEEYFFVNHDMEGPFWETPKPKEL